MAKAKMFLPDGYMMRLAKLGRSIDDISKEVLRAGAEVAYKQVKYHLVWVIGNDTKYPSRSTGELEKSLGISKTDRDREGNMNIKVGFSEHRHDGRKNYIIVRRIEYGYHGQPAKPFMARAKRESKAQITYAMKQKFDEEVGKL